MILYACVAAGPKILAEHDSNSDNGGLAAQCLQCVPKFHTIYTHTTGNKIYAFLISQSEEPITFFAIAEESFGRPNALDFLRRLRKCYELRTHMDFSQLVLSASISSSPLPKLPFKDDGKGDEDEDGHETEIDVADCEKDSLNRGGLSPWLAKRSREEAWRKCVRVVILVDLLVCCLMFGIWLTLCRGLRCIRR